MNFNLIFWVTTLTIVKRQSAQEIFPKAKLISSGQYKVFIPTKSVYAALATKECSQLKGENVKTSGSENINLLIENLKQKPRYVDTNILSAVCRFTGIYLLNKNIIKMIDNEPCQYDKGYCYDNNNTFIFWNNTPIYDPIVIYDGALDLWEVEMLEISTKLKFFVHRFLNLTIKMNQERKMDDNSTIFSSSIDDIFLKFLFNITPANHYINRNFTDIYFGKLNNRTTHGEILNEDRTVKIGTEIKVKNCEACKNKNNNGSSNCIVKCRLKSPKNEPNTSSTFNVLTMVLLLISVIGNCLGMICFLTYCHKNRYLKKSKPDLPSKSIKKITNYTNSKPKFCIQENDLYEPSKNNQSQS